MILSLLLCCIAGIDRVLVRNPAFDACSLLGGTSSMLQSLVTSFSYSPSYFLDAFEPVLLPGADRRVATELLHEAVEVCAAAIHRNEVDFASYMSRLNRGMRIEGGVSMLNMSVVNISVFGYTHSDYSSRLEGCSSAELHLECLPFVSLLSYYVTLTIVRVLRILLLVSRSIDRVFCNGCVVFCR